VSASCHKDARRDAIAADLARTALEVCEFSSGGPCAIVSIDGYDTALKSGGWAKEPAMVSIRPSDFDPVFLPFVPASARSPTAAYQKATGPRAFAVTTAGGWLCAAGPQHRQGHQPDADRLRGPAPRCALHSLCRQ